MELCCHALCRLGSFTTRRAKPTRWGTVGVRKTLADDVTFRLFDMVAPADAPTLMEG